MCEPTTIMALSSLALSTFGAVQQSKAQQSALDDSTHAAAEEAGARIQQETGERVAQARRERSRLIVAAGESGLAANSGSFEAQIADSFGKQNRDLALISKNAGFAERGINTQAAGEAAKIRSGLQIAGSALGKGATIWSQRPASTSKSTPSGSMSPVPPKPKTLTVFGNPEG